MDGILRRRHSALDPALSSALSYGQARVGDLRWPLGADDPQPGPEPLGRGLEPTELAEQIRELYALHDRTPEWADLNRCAPSGSPYRIFMLHH